MNSIVERILPSVVGRAVVMGELRESVLAPPRSSHPDVDPAETLPVVTVGIVGLGYVGLPTALALVEGGVRVLGCDVSETRLAAIKAGQVDLLAADHDRLGRFVGAEELVLTTEPRALAAADVVMICVPTPVDEHLVPDLTALRGACESAVEHAVAGQTVVLTIECTRRAVEVLRRVAPALHAVSSPEAAEMTKLLENTFRAVNIALVNEFSTLARELDVDPIEVIGAAATKPYGFMPFYPGPGAVGHCIPCDPHYLLWQLKARRTAAPLITAAMEGIAARPRAVVARAQEVLAEHCRPLRGSRVLVVGVTYKPGVADVRASPALEILAELAAAGAQVAYSDPMIEVVRTATAHWSVRMIRVAACGTSSLSTPGSRARTIAG
jgi:UDP-N-acetyl-D-mannosaminuronate dehydrogenase